MKGAVLVLAVCAVAAGVPDARSLRASGQQQAGSVAPAPSQETAAGTGRISGRVVEARTGRPLGGVLLQLSAIDLAVSRYTTTGADGTYRLTNLPAGKYRLRGMRPAYLSAGYGEDLTTGEGPKTIELTDGQALEEIDVGLPKGAVIAGRVATALGDPVPGVSVQVVVVTDPDDPSTVQRSLPVPSRRSDDLGQYRLFGIPPGEFYIVAGLGRERAISSDAAVDPELAAALAAGAAGYTETYHPEAPTPATARRVAVQAGDELNGIDIVLIPAPFRPPTVYIHRK